MSIFPVLIKNLRTKPLTLRLPEETSHPKDFRGPVKIDVKKCIGCGMCAYVCPSWAVRVTEHEDSFEWRYLPGNCTFCGRCMTVCPAEALHMERGSAPAYFRAGELNETHLVPYPVCPDCGKPTIPVAEPVLIRVYGKLNEKMRSGIFLCQRCRLRRSQRDLRATAGGAINSKDQSPA